MRRFWLPAGLAAGLSLCAAAEVLAGAPDAVSAATPGALAVAPGTGAAGGGADAVFTPRWASIILARPLFRTDRRPPAALAAAPVDETLPRLSAIVVTANGRSAIFAADGGMPAVVAAGGRIGAYLVRRIAPDSVSLAGPNGPVTVHPEYAPAGASTPAAPAAPPPPAPRRLSNDPI